MKRRVKNMMFGSYLLILVIGMIIYLGVRYETEKKMRGFYIEKQQAVMQQAIMGVDGELETIKRFGLKLARDPYVELFSYVQEPLDQYDLEHAVKLVRNIRSHYIDNSLIEDFYIYYGNSDRVANSNSFYQSKDYYQLEWSIRDQEAEQWKRSLAAPVQGGFSPAVSMVNGGKQSTFIPYTYRFGSQQDANVSVIVILLRKTWLDESLKDISEGGKTVIRMGDEPAAIITFENSESLKSFSPDKLEWNRSDETWKIVEWEGQSYLATRILSEKSGWQYESLIPYKIITEQMKGATSPLFAGLLLYGLIGIPVCLFLAFKSYKPINRLASQVEQLTDGKEREYRDEIEYIYSGIENIHKKYRELEAEHDDTLQEYNIAAAKLKKNRERIQESILMQLLTGRWQDESELETRFQGQDISFPYETYCAAVVRIEHHEEAEQGQLWETKEKSLTTFILKNVSKELLEPAGSVYLLSGDSDDINILFNLDTDGYEDMRISASVQELLTELKDYLRSVLQIQVSIGVGMVCDRRKELNHSYNQAKAALEYCFIAGESSIVIYNDLEKNEKNKPYYPDNKIEKMIIHGIAQQDSQACEQILDEFYQEVFMRRITVMEGRQLHIFLTDLAMKLIAKSGAAGTIEGFCQDLVGKMLNCKTLPDTLPLMKTLLTCLCQAREGLESGLGAEAVQFIKDNYRNCNLSLQLCADVFQVTPEHLSRTIKVESGRTFMEIVNYLRIEQAKFHLVQSNKKMEIVAELSGFGTTKSFFRSFKQAEGVPPGVWRKMHHKI